MTATREDTAVRNCSTRPATPNRPLPVVLTHRLFRPGTSRPGRKTAPSSCSARQKKRQKKSSPNLAPSFQPQNSPVRGQLQSLPVARILARTAMPPVVTVRGGTRPKSGFFRDGRKNFLRVVENLAHAHTFSAAMPRRGSFVVH
uniref:(northern house mosquito) hypothetical protein n=1 Tax=Culex pipiens TaxID=7175 RepID=A0A8D8FE48_CULPI